MAAAQITDEAYVTLATNDSYSLGALTMGYSLKRVGTTRTLVCLITKEVSQAVRDQLSRIFTLVEVNILDSQDAVNLELLTRPDLGVTFTKLHCWRLTQFKKCVFLDADTLILQNIDDLFEREELSAAADVGWPDCFNSGVFVYKPSEKTYEELLRFALDQGSFDGGDQGLLNSYFSDWATKDIKHHLPFLYNVVAQSFYTYLPAFKRFGKDAKVLHFIGMHKPWHSHYHSDTGVVDCPGDLGLYCQDFLKLWWNIFYENVRFSGDSLEKFSVPPYVGRKGFYEYELMKLGGSSYISTSQKPGLYTYEQLDNKARQQDWERGNIDFMGIDSFEYIKKQLDIKMGRNQNDDLESYEPQIFVDETSQIVATQPLQPLPFQQQQFIQPHTSVLVKREQVPLSQVPYTKVIQPVSFSKSNENSDFSHRQEWESGHVDFLGKDSFENIQKRLDAKIKKVPSPVVTKTPLFFKATSASFPRPVEPSKVLATQTFDQVSTVAATSPLSSVATTSPLASLPKDQLTDVPKQTDESKGKIVSTEPVSTESSQDSVNLVTYLERSFSLPDERQQLSEEIKHKPAFLVETIKKPEVKDVELIKDILVGNKKFHDDLKKEHVPEESKDTILLSDQRESVAKPDSQEKITKFSEENTKFYPTSFIVETESAAGKISKLPSPVKSDKTDIDLKPGEKLETGEKFSEESAKCYPIFPSKDSTSFTLQSSTPVVDSGPIAEKVSKSYISTEPPVPKLAFVRDEKITSVQSELEKPPISELPTLQRIDFIYNKKSKEEIIFVTKEMHPQESTQLSATQEVKLIEKTDSLKEPLQETKTVDVTQDFIPMPHSSQVADKQQKDRKPGSFMMKSSVPIARPGPVEEAVSKSYAHVQKEQHKFESSQSEESKKPTDVSYIVKEQKTFHGKDVVDKGEHIYKQVEPFSKPEMLEDYLATTTQFRIEHKTVAKPIKPKDVSHHKPSEPLQSEDAGIKDKVFDKTQQTKEALLYPGKSEIKHVERESGSFRIRSSFQDKKPGHVDEMVSKSLTKIETDDSGKDDKSKYAFILGPSKEDKSKDTNLKKPSEIESESSYEPEIQSRNYLIRTRGDFRLVEDSETGEETFVHQSIPADVDVTRESTEKILDIMDNIPKTSEENETHLEDYLIRTRDYPYSEVKESFYYDKSKYAFVIGPSDKNQLADTEDISKSSTKTKTEDFVKDDKSKYAIIIGPSEENKSTDINLKKPSEIELESSYEPEIQSRNYLIRTRAGFRPVEGSETGEETIVRQNTSVDVDVTRESTEKTSDIMDNISKTSEENETHLEDYLIRTRDYPYSEVKESFYYDKSKYAFVIGPSEKNQLADTEDISKLSTKTKTEDFVKDDKSKYAIIIGPSEENKSTDINLKKPSEIESESSYEPEIQSRNYLIRTRAGFRPVEVSETGEETIVRQNTSVDVDVTRESTEKTSDITDNISKTSEENETHLEDYLIRTRDYPYSEVKESFYYDNSKYAFVVEPSDKNQLADSEDISKSSTKTKTEDFVKDDKSKYAIIIGPSEENKSTDINLKKPSEIESESSYEPEIQSRNYLIRTRAGFRPVEGSETGEETIVPQSIPVDVDVTRESTEKTSDLTDKIPKTSDETITQLEDYLIRTRDYTYVETKEPSQISSIDDNNNVISGTQRLSKTIDKSDSLVIGTSTKFQEGKEKPLPTISASSESNKNLEIKKTSTPDKTPETGSDSEDVEYVEEWEEVHTYITDASGAIIGEQPVSTHDVSRYELRTTTAKSKISSPPTTKQDVSFHESVSCITSSRVEAPYEEYTIDKSELDKIEPQQLQQIQQPHHLSQQEVADQQWQIKDKEKQSQLSTSGKNLSDEISGTSTQIHIGPTEKMTTITHEVLRPLSRTDLKSHAYVPQGYKSHAFAQPLKTIVTTTTTTTSTTTVETRECFETVDVISGSIESQSPPVSSSTTKDVYAPRDPRIMNWYSSTTGSLQKTKQDCATDKIKFDSLHGEERKEGKYSTNEAKWTVIYDTTIKPEKISTDDSSVELIYKEFFGSEKQLPKSIDHYAGIIILPDHEPIKLSDVQLEEVIMTSRKKSLISEVSLPKTDDVSSPPVSGFQKFLSSVKKTLHIEDKKEEKPTSPTSPTTISTTSTIPTSTTTSVSISSSSPSAQPLFSGITSIKIKTSSDKKDKKK